MNLALMTKYNFCVLEDMDFTQITYTNVTGTVRRSFKALRTLASLTVIYFIYDVVI